MKPCNIKCCMCEKKDDNDTPLIALECLNKHGKAGHRICQYCWWNKFALEDVSHKCPGCVKGLRLTKFKKEPAIFIDLTQD